MSKRIATELIVAAAAAGCGLFEPPTLEVYHLTEVNGQPVPALGYTINFLGGSTYGLRFDEGELTLTGSSRFRRIFVARQVHNGVPEAILRKSDVRGHYTRTDSTITFTYSDNLGPHTVSYRLLPGTAGLFGLEVVSLAATVGFRFERAQAP